MISLNRASELLEYDEVSGKLTWKKRQGTSRGVKSFNSRFAGKEAGTLRRQPKRLRTELTYIYVCIDGKLYGAHRIAWLLSKGEWPTDPIDHKDRNGQNNAIANLRKITTSSNILNSKLSRRSKTGVKGVHYDKSRKKWLAHVTINRKFINLGRFDSLEEAEQARLNYFPKTPLDG